MARLLTLLIVLGISVPRAFAEPTVGVVVTGDDTVHSTGVVTVEEWLGKHNFRIAGAPLDKDGVNTLSNCLAIADLACARGVVEKRSKADTVVVIVATTSGPAKKRDIQLSAFWMTKRSDVVSLQKMCNHCTKDTVPPTLEALMTDLAKLVPAMTGKLSVTSTPAGLLVTLDNEALGVTPLDKDVATGSHEVSLTRDGKVVDKKPVTITAGQTATVALVAPPLPVVKEAPPPPVVTEQRSRAVPAVMIGVGLAAIATGAVMYAEGGPSGTSFYYRDLKPPGIGVAAGGAALGVVGAILFMRGGSSSAPTVALTPNNAYVGWAGRF